MLRRVVVALALVAVGCSGGEGHAEYPYPVQTFEDQCKAQASCIQAPGQPFGYNSNPPTSGPHFADAADWGVQSHHIPKEVALKNMEQGGIVVWYNCAAEPPLDGLQCQELRIQLGEIVQRTAMDGNLVLMIPYEQMEHRIALTAWRTLDAFDQFDGKRVQAFIDAYERKFTAEGS